ncbi:MAG: S9 family peptidase [Burkholderiales bacterium]|nr:S9 family peptidase [Burkholderiales bacterium]
MNFSTVLQKLDTLHTISDLSFTPDGQSLISTLNFVDVEKNSSVSEIIRIDLQGKSSLLVSGKHRHLAATQSPISTQIAFLSDRVLDGKLSLMLREESGALRALAETPCTLESYHWSADGQYLVALGADHGLNSGAVNSAMRYHWGTEDGPESASNPVAKRRLFRIPANGDAYQEISLNGLSVWEFALLPEGIVAVVSEDASERGWHHAFLIYLDRDGQQERLRYQPEWQIQGLKPSPDGESVAFLEGWSSDRGLVAGVATTLNLRTGERRQLAGELSSNMTYLHWRDTHSLWFAGWQGMGSVYGLLHVDGQILCSRFEALCLSENQFRAQVCVSPCGSQLAAVREGRGVPPELVYKRSFDDEWVRLSYFNRALEDFPDYPLVHKIEWQGAEGLPLEGLVLLPCESDGQALPMIVDIHGGPSLASKFSFNPNSVLPYVAAGYAVFLPNYRGNVGWGAAFARMNLGDPAGREFEDIMCGVDACIAAGFADGGRLGVTGASYGGYLTNWAVATTSRFKAAVAIASISNQISCHYTCEHDFHRFINGGSLNEDENFDLAWHRSPLAQIKKNEHPCTATLLLHGREDRCTPLGQAREFHQALRERGLDTELVIYPGEGHQLRKRAHKIDAWYRKRAWFDRYLLAVAG